MTAGMRSRGRRALQLLGTSFWLRLAAVAAGAVAAGAAAAAPRAAAAQTAYLVADVVPGEGGATGSNPTHFLPAGRRLFFEAAPGDPQRQVDRPELWVTDGTAAGTRRLPSHCQRGFCGPGLVASIGDLAFFVESGRLWRSDGTQAGTAPLTAELSFGEPSPYAVLDGVLYFIAYQPSSPAPSQQLWRSDGTAAGTSLVFDVGPGLGNLHQDVLLAAGGRLFFRAPEPGPFNSWNDLWVSDGTAQGTGPVTSFRETGPVGIVEIAAADNQVFFIAGQNGLQTSELWVSDGTRAGTRRVATVTPALFATLLPAGRKVYFDAQDAEHRPQLWVSDGTASGTRPVTAGSGFGLPVPLYQVAELGSRLVFIGGGSLWAAALGSTGPAADLCRQGGCGPLDQNSRLYRLGGRVAFFAGSPAGGYSLWSSDGTPGGTLRVKEACPAPCGTRPSPTQVGGSLFFPVSESDFIFELWRSDGTLPGTGRFSSRLLTDHGPPAVAALGDQVFFAATDDTTSAASKNELWVSGPTGADARQLADSTDAQSSGPGHFTPVGNGIFFTISAVVPGDLNIWRSAGTAASTLPVPQRTEGIAVPVAAFGGVVFTGGPGGPQDPTQLYWSDGTVMGTRQLTAFSQPQSAYRDVTPVLAAGLVYFVATLGTGSAIWRSDGTAQGTVEVVRLPPEVPHLFSLSVLGNDFYMVASPGSALGGLWKSDGTPGGTVQLTRFGFFDVGLTPLGGLAYFIATDQRDNALTHLWQTDGTPAGTVPVGAGGFSFANASDLRAAGGALYLFADAPGSAHRNLLRTDGTESGTQVLGTFAGGNGGLYRSGGLTPFGGGFVFFADDGIHGTELWATDGTPGGTRLVRDIQPGVAGSNPSSLAVAGGRLFFAADDGVHGIELWESDGTAAGTHMVQDINPGPASSGPWGMTEAGGLLYFSADDGLNGQELWALPLGGAAGCQPSATALCVAGERFKVEAFWRDFQGRSGAGQARPLTGDTGAFWFFGPENLEVVLKVLDGRALNGEFWVFYGALSSVEYYLTVTDTATGVARRYYNPTGQLASVGDTSAFGPMGAASIRMPAGRPATGAAAPAARSLKAGKAMTPQASGSAGSDCQPGPLRLCLNGGRFAVEASWTDFSGRSGAGTAVGLTAETGYFWFFDAGNVETVLKVIDGRGLNGHFWVFYGALSNVQYTLTITDTATGAAKTYTNPAGQFASVADTSAF